MFWIRDKIKLLATDEGSLVLGVTIFSIVLLGVGSNFVEKDIGIGLLTFLGIILAVLKYYYETNKDRKTETIDLISFFRKEVLVQGDALHLLFRSNKQGPVRVKLDVRTMSEAIRTYPVEIKKQVKLLEEQETLDSALRLANVLEEFSARVLTLSAKKETSLHILHDSFIKLAETISSVIFYDRERSGNLNFTNTLKLYDSWKR